jgi:hypothetical protein
LAAALVKIERTAQARAAIHESLRAASRAGRAAVFDAMPVVAMILALQDELSANGLVKTVLEVDSWWTDRRTGDVHGDTTGTRHYLMRPLT